MFKQILSMVGFALLLFIILCLLPGCASTRPLVSDIGDGASEYRAIQDNIRAGETELAITGTRIEERVGELERSIRSSQTQSNEIERIIQQIRERELNSDLFEEWRNR